MNNALERINIMMENIRDNIYDYNIKRVFTSIDSLFGEIINYIELETLPKEKISIFNSILENINISIRNKDYLLLSDLLKFQLKDFVKSIQIKDR